MPAPTGDRSRTVIPTTSCVVVAAGAGRRMLTAKNKVLLEVAGEPILLHTLRHLARSGAIAELVVVCREEDQSAFESLVAAEPALPTTKFVRGGAERDDSVGAGLAGSDPDARIVLIHDAARPFVSARLVGSLIEAAASHGAAIPVLPISDTVKRVSGGRIVSTLDRSELGAAQTPQAFVADALRVVRAGTRPDRSPTDDSARFELDGRTVVTVPGDPWNVKLTTPDDLALAPALLLAFRAREAARLAEERR